MRRPRLSVIACCLLLAAVSLGVPAVALAGGSAGDKQYTDPFSTSGGGQTSSATATATPTQTATTPPPAATTPAATTPVETTPAATTPAAATPAPTATIAGPQPGTLPYTGFAAWAAAGFGGTLLAAGLLLRLRTARD